MTCLAAHPVTIKHPDPYTRTVYQSLADCLDRAAVRTVFDIGAADCSDSLRLLQLFPGARVHAFEPDPRHMPAPDDARLHFNPFAVGAETGPAPWHRSGGQRAGWASKDWEFSGSLRRPTGHLAVYPDVTFAAATAQVITLDDYWRDESAIDLMWMDVQGAELDVIIGGRKTLARTRFILTEYSDTPLYEDQLPLAGILAMLPGWSLVQRFKWDALLRNDAFQE